MSIPGGVSQKETLLWQRNSGFVIENWQESSFVVVAHFLTPSPSLTLPLPNAQTHKHTQSAAAPSSPRCARWERSCQTSTPIASALFLPQFNTAEAVTVLTSLPPKKAQTLASNIHRDMYIFMMYAHKSECTHTFIHTPHQIHTYAAASRRRWTPNWCPPAGLLILRWHCHLCRLSFPVSLENREQDTHTHTLFLSSLSSLQLTLLIGSKLYCGLIDACFCASTYEINTWTWSQVVKNIWLVILHSQILQYVCLLAALDT